MTITEKIIGVVAPFDCLGCSQEGSLLCADCAGTIAAIPEHCYRCKQYSRDSAVCKKCRVKGKLSYVWLRTLYEGVPKGLVRKLKFERAGAAAKEIAALIDASLPYLPEHVYITHIPTASVRIRARGYDQAEHIARELGLLRRRRHLKLLARTTQTRQVGATRKLRLTQLEGAFRPIRTDSIKDSHILLVDDVMTTGATIEAAARTLKAAGAKRIDAVIFAYKQ